MILNISDNKGRKVYIRESQCKLMLENSRDRRINQLISTYYPNADFQEIRNVRAIVLNHIPFARTRGEKWLYRIVDWYLSDEMPSNEYGKMNRFLGWLRKNNYPISDVNDTDWTHIPFSYIKSCYDKLFSNAYRPSVSSSDAKKVQHINGYTIRRIDNEEEADLLGYTKYKNEWCVLDGSYEYVGDLTLYIVSNDSTYSSVKKSTVGQTKNLLRKMGGDDVCGVFGDTGDKYNVFSFMLDYDYDLLTTYIDNYASFGTGLPPYDAYGLSAFAVLVDDDGQLNSSYSRYNIPDDCDGQFLDESEISKLLGVNFEEVFPYVEKSDINEGRIISEANEDSSRYSHCGFEMLVGIPGCGKSTYLSGIKRDGDNIIIVSPDDLRRKMTGSVSDQSRNDDVWESAHTMIYDSLAEGNYVILDATNVGTTNRVRLLNNVKSKYPGVPCYATVFDCNPEVSKQRIARDIENHVDRSDVPADAIDNMYRKYLETLKVIKDEGFDDVFFV